MNKNVLYKRIIGNRKAFTMVELLVSISIIVIITSLFLANYREGNKKNEINIAAHNLTSDIRRAQNNSLGLIKYAGAVPGGGWGISIDMNSDNTSYKIFADINENKRFDTGEDDAIYGGNTVFLSSGILFDFMDIANPDNEGGGNNRQIINITFLPPDPITYIYDGATEYNQVYIGLASDEGDTKQIEVNFLGLIDIIQ